MTALGTGSSIQELQERRAWECRLTPDRALETLDDAEAFLRDRGLLTRTTDCALPSLFEACHEDPYAPDKPGFGQWPVTKWWWGGALARRPGVHALKVHRGKNLFVTDETAALLDPVCRSELARMEADAPDWARLLRHLAAAGPSTLEDLQHELSLRPKELKATRFPLELCGAVVSRQVAAGEGDYVTELARWDQVVPESPGGGVEDVVVAGVHAAVLAPEREVARWFSWRWLWRDDLVDGLVASGRLTRPAPGWLAAGTA
jgi:hypothetical protein